MPAAETQTICVYCDTWAQGGIETFIAETLLNMDGESISFRLVCAEKRGSRFDGRLEKMGLSVDPLLRGEEASALRKTLKTAIPLAKLCKRERIETVHLNAFHGLSFVQAFVLKLYGVKRVIVHCHGAGLRESGGKALKLLGHRIGKTLFSWTADERWAASQAAASFLFGNKPVQIIPNGIEVQRFCFREEKRFELRKRLQVGDRKLLGCVGRMDTQKNQQFLLTLLAVLKERGGTAMLLLIGDGEKQKELRAQAEELGLCEDVAFLGISDRVNEWMWAMDALLIPSISEGLGIVALEGQAAGLPVLCSTGVPQEVQLSETVRFLPLSDREQWIREIENLPTYDRTAVNEQIKSSKYEVKRTADMVKKLYLKKQGA